MHGLKTSERATILDLDASKRRWAVAMSMNISFQCQQPVPHGCWDDSEGIPDSFPGLLRMSVATSGP